MTGLPVYSREELQFLNCVCTDIDLAHNGEQFDFDTQVQQVLDFTLTAQLPFPSMVSDSGRGMWLFWLLKDRRNPGPLSAHRNLQTFHSRLLSAAVVAYRKFNSGTDSSCTDSQRLARFPGSINSNSGTVARYFRASDRVFTFPELADGFGVKPRKTAITLREELAAECTGKPDCKCGGQRYDGAGKPKKPACLTMRAVAAKIWWSSRDLPLPRSNSVLHPVSPEPPHETTIPKLPHSVRLTTGSRGVPILPPNHCPFSTSAQNLAPSPRKLQPNQSCQRSSYVPDLSRSLSPHHQYH